MRRKSYLFRKAPRKGISVRALLLGLIGGLAIAPPASPQISANPSALSIDSSHGSVAGASSHKTDQSALVR